jgi:putative transcriptional regulator
MQEHRQKYVWDFWIIFFIIISIFYMGCTSGQPFQYREEVARQMSLALQQKDVYNQMKLNDIDSIRNFLNTNSNRMTCEEKFQVNVDLYNEFKLYSFDSAFHYATQLCRIANDIDSSAYRVDARTRLGYILARGGFFKEAIDSLSSIRIDKEVLPAKVLSDYYISFGRVYHDLADYTKDNVFSSRYNQIGNELLMESLPYLSDSSTIYYVRGKVALKEDKLAKSKQLYQRSLELCDTTDTETLSVLLSTMAYVNRKLELNDEAIHYYVKAAVNDIRSATKESVSMRGLATMLYYYKNDVNLASEYINEAFEDATFYGTRHRINVIGTLFPVFVGEKLGIEQVKRQTFQDSFILSSVFAVVLIIAIIYILMQMKHLRRSRQLLEKLNLKLSEANRIKNSYIGHYLDATFKLVNQLDNFVLVGQQKLDSKQYDSLSSMIHNLNSDFNRKSAFADFDRTFLSLFPTFVESFNSLLQPDDKFVLENKGALNSTLRIFALIRLGITESEQISEILGYSVNTVYNYRVRTRNKAVDPANFEKDVRKIGL